jgi:outer membrane protein TolC
MTHLWLIAALTLGLPAPAGLMPPSGPAAVATLQAAAEPLVALLTNDTAAALTIDAAVAIALDRHPSIRAAEFGIVAAREHIGEAAKGFGSRDDFDIFSISSQKGE